VILTPLTTSTYASRSIYLFQELVVLMTLLGFLHLLGPKKTLGRLKIPFYGDYQERSASRRIILKAEKAAKAYRG
jgi:hypothetical protein